MPNTDTRTRLLDAAARLFAAHGYDGVSTRALARAADVNIAAIGYHFGGKKELYTAVIHHAVEATNSIANPVAEGLQAGIAAANGDRRLLAKTADRFVRTLIHGLGSDPQVSIWIAMIQQEFAHPSDAIRIVLDGRILPMHRAFTALTAAALGGKVDDPAVIVRSHAVVGQVLIFFLARVVLLARTGWNDYDPETLAVMKGEIAHSVLGSLGLPIPDTEEATG